MSGHSLIESLIGCDVCGEPATIGFTADEMAIACGDGADAGHLCDEHGSIGEEGGHELEQAEGARLIGALSPLARMS